MTDLKPDNLFIVPDIEAEGGERAKILDFGLAKIRTSAEPRSAPAPAAESGLRGPVMGTVQDFFSARR